MTSEKLLCTYPFTHFEVNNPTGDVTMCCNHARVLGNVFKQTIRDIWNGPAYQEMRAVFLAGRTREVCSENCPVLKGWKDYENLDWYQELPADSAVYRNAVLNEDETAAGKTVLVSQPRWIRFASSYRCNLRCYHCFQENDRRAARCLPPAFFTDVENFLENLQVLFFYGGEPFMEKRNLDLMKLAAERDFLLRVFIITNGTILNDTIKTVLSRLHYGLIAVSIDSIREQLYEELRAPAQWVRVYENLHFFSELMQRKRGRLHFSLTVNKKNMEELSDFIVFSRGFKSVPLFQFAGNSFADKKYRDEYEIYTREELTELMRVLTAALETIDPQELPLTVKNLQALREDTMVMLRNRTRVARMLQFLRRKKKIYMKKIKEWLV